MGGMFGFFVGSAQKPTQLKHARACAEAHHGKLFKRFFHAMLEAGIYWPPSPYEACFVSAAHSSADIDQTLDAARKILRQITVAAE